MVHCPRCDKPFRDMKREEAMAKMMGHVELAHRDYMENLED